MNGYRPIVELMNTNFGIYGMAEISSAGNTYATTGGQFEMPLTIIGAGGTAPNQVQHSILRRRLQITIFTPCIDHPAPMNPGAGARRRALAAIPCVRDGDPRPQDLLRRLRRRGVRHHQGDDTR